MCHTGPAFPRNDTPTDAQVGSNIFHTLFWMHACQHIYFGCVFAGSIGGLHYFHNAVKNTSSARPRHFMMLWKIQFLPGHAIPWCCEKHNFCPATPFHDGEKTPILHGCAIFTMVRKYECWVLKAGNQAFHHGMKMHFPGTGIAEFFYFINVWNGASGGLQMPGDDF